MPEARLTARTVTVADFKSRLKAIKELESQLLGQVTAETRSSLHQTLAARYAEISMPARARSHALEAEPASTTCSDAVTIGESEARTWRPKTLDPKDADKLRQIAARRPVRESDGSCEEWAALGDDLFDIGAFSGAQRAFKRAADRSERPGPYRRLAAVMGAIDEAVRAHDDCFTSSDGYAVGL